MHCINEYLHGIPGDGHEDGEAHTGIRFEQILAPDGLAVYSGEDLRIIVQGYADAENAPRSWTPAFQSSIRSRAPICMSSSVRSAEFLSP